MKGVWIWICVFLLAVASAERLSDQCIETRPPPDRHCVGLLGPKQSMPNLIAAPHDRDSQGIAGRLEPGEWMADDGLMWRTPVGFRPEVYTCFHTFEDALSWLNTQTGAKESFVGLASLRWIPLNYAQIGMHTVKKEVEVNEPKMGWKLKEDL